MITTIRQNDATYFAELRDSARTELTKIAEENAEAMKRVALGILHDEADACDAVQDAFVSAIQALSRYEGQSTVRTWFHRIVVNVCLMKLRTRRRRKSISLDDAYNSDCDACMSGEIPCSRTEEPCEAMLKSEQRDQLRASIQSLPSAFRSILVIRDIEGFDTQQAAKMLGATPGAIKTKLHRARQALREQLCSM